MRFRARLPLRVRGCAIPTTEQRLSRDFRVRRNSGLSCEKSERKRIVEGAAEVDELVWALEKSRKSRKSESS